MVKISGLSLIFIFLVNILIAETYFPPSKNSEWERIEPSELSWELNEINNLYDFLESKNTKAFIVLKDGKIVIEKYFGNFRQDSNWYWASAGKALTATIVGIAQDEKYINISDITSKYLGIGWTSLQKEQEDLITVKHQLTMTSGLDDKVDDLYCTKPECLKYLADAGTRWSYHNAPYTLLDKVVESATGKNFNVYFAEKIRNKIGMNGLWIKQDFNNIYFSNPLSMARFGVLIQNDGYWRDNDIIKDKNYLDYMLNTSQNINLSYGYLWWLNGKGSFMIPGSQIKFNQDLFPDAPKDMFSALGKNGQILNISKSTGLIVVRLGESPGSALEDITPEFNNNIWKYLNRIIGSNDIIDEFGYQTNFLYPNHCIDYIQINSNEVLSYEIYNLLGSKLYSNINNIRGSKGVIDVSNLSKGVYIMKMNMNNSFIIKPFIKE